MTNINIITKIIKICSSISHFLAYNLRYLRLQSDAHSDKNDFNHLNNVRSI